jgi:hypothetical protein
MLAAAGRARHTPRRGAGLAGRQRHHRHAGRAKNRRFARKTIEKGAPGFRLVAKRSHFRAAIAQVDLRPQRAHNGGIKHGLSQYA